MSGSNDGQGTPGDPDTLADQYFEYAAAIMVQLDTNGHIDRINKRGRDFLGYEKDELVGKDWFETVVPSDLSIDVSDVFDALLDEGATRMDVHENYIRTNSGERRRIKWHNSVLRGRDGKIEGILASGSDITESKQRERKLQRLTDEYESVIENAGDAIFLIDVEQPKSDLTFRYRYLNPAHEERTGLTTERVQGKTPEEVLGSELGEKVRSNYQACVDAGEPITYYEELEMPEGRIVFQTKLSPVIIGGNATRIVGVARDLTERIDREEELQRQNKRLDEFANVLSHDLRNPLTVAQGRTDLIAEECQSEHIQPVTDALNRMEHMIEDTLTLARKGEKVTVVESIQISDIADECWSMVETDAATITIQDEFTFQGDPSRVRHILENLFRNAVQHGGNGVSVRIGALGDEGFYVEDDGPGIPADMRETVFQTGESTAEEGTGFGLTIVRRIAEAHGWDVSVTESDSGGARFEFSGVEVEC